MTPGLKIVVTPGNYYGLTQVGWLRSTGGDEYELVGARTIRTVRDYIPLATLANGGPTKDVRLQDASARPEEIHRLLIRRCIPANEEKWAAECPKPKGWGK